MLSPSMLLAALDFRRERDWEQFHTPQNLAIAISVEAGELLEQFQWIVAPQSRPAEERMAAIQQEVADIAILLSYLASDLGIDIDTAVQHKLALNAKRYPVDKSRGTATKYDKL